MQKNQEKFTFQPKKKAFSKRLEEVSQNHSKYLFTNSDERGSNESFNENEKDLLQTINYKTILDHSKNDKDEFLNFTYFSKEIGLSDEKNPKKYLFLIRSKSKQKKLNNLTFSNNKSNCKYISNVTKKLPDISKDSIDRIEDVSIFQNKERKNNSNFYLSKISHKKNNAIDYKNNNISSNKKEEEQNIPINSTENFEKPQTTGQINEKIIKSKLFDEKKLIFKANWSDIVNSINKRFKL